MITRKNPLVTPGTVKDFAIFQDLSQDQIQRFLDMAVYRHIPCEQDLLQQGEAPNGIFLIVSGGATVSIVLSNGEHSNLIRAGRGELLGDVESLTGQPCLATVTAESECCTLSWSGAALDLFRDDCTIMRNIMRIFYARLAIINQVHTIEHKATVDHKIYACLLRMVGPDMLIKHSQTYIAETVGCSRQTVNRVLGKLRDEEIVALRKSQIAVLDPERLRTLLPR